MAPGSKVQTFLGLEVLPRSKNSISRKTALLCRTSLLYNHIPPGTPCPEGRLSGFGSSFEIERKEGAWNEPYPKIIADRDLYCFCRVDSDSTGDICRHNLRIF